MSAPASTRSADGLGPLYNARSCQGCHLRDGRGRVPEPDEPAVSLLFRISVPPTTDAERALLAAGRAGVIAEPVYGTQIQPFSVQGQLGEARVATDWEERVVTLADGTAVRLRAPRYRITGANYGPMRADVMLSPRLAPPMIGLGLLEMVPEADILAAADPDDRDGDGISGRPNQVWSRALAGSALGRFGWKAGEATIADQAAGAFAADIGLSTPLIPEPWGDCSPAQEECRRGPHGLARGETTEVSSTLFDLVVFYSRNLAVPPRRDVEEAAVRRGEQLFAAVGCASCHRPRFVTGRDPARPEHSAIAIRPYTDLLLHDMGNDLADGRPDWQASGREWRTAPLWGLGLTRTVSEQVALLHDGRARSPLEAILWHGGEAQAARDRVVALSHNERAALLAFLDSL